MLALIERERTGQRSARRRGDARLPRRRRRAGQPVLVLPEGARAPADLPPRPAHTDPASAVPVRRRPLGVLRHLRRRTEGVADAASSGWTRKDLAVDLAPAGVRSTRRTASRTSTTSRSVVEVFFLLQTADEAYHDGQARGLAIGPINSPDDLSTTSTSAPGASSSTSSTTTCPPALYPGRAVPVLGVRQRAELRRAPNAGRAHRRSAGPAEEPNPGRRSQ